MNREELQAALENIVAQATSRFGAAQAARVEQLTAHAKTVGMCIDHLFDTEANEGAV